jgi:hypothetical protein
VLWLTEDELIELAGYQTARPQKRALGQMGRVRSSDGFPLVDRWQFELDLSAPPR